MHFKLPNWAVKPKYKEDVVATSKGWEVKRTGEVLRSVRNLDTKLAELVSELQMKQELVQVLIDVNVVEDKSDEATDTQDQNNDQTDADQKDSEGHSEDSKSGNSETEESKVIDESSLKTEVKSEVEDDQKESKESTKKEEPKVEKPKKKPGRKPGRKPKAKK